MKHQLKKVLGLSFGVAVVIGGTIGVGILRTPGDIAALLPNAWLIMICWLLAGLYILLAASSYAELSTMLPKAGGAYNYIKRAFGDYAGFMSGWFDYIINAIAPAYFCIVLSEYIIRVFPGIHVNPKWIAEGFLILFTLIHIPGIKGGSLLQQVTSAIKVFLFFVLILACFIGGDVQEGAFRETQAEVLRGVNILAVFKALQLILGTYDGWMSVSFFAEENDNPGRVIPRAYFLGAVTVMSLYLLVNAAILYVIPVAALGQSPLAAADAAGVVFGSSGMTFVTIFALFSLLSILNAYMMIPSRILYGLSRDGFFFKQGAIINEGGTPFVALLCSFAISFSLILFSSFNQLFSLASFMAILVTGMAYASVLQLRKTEPGLERPYRAWGYPYSTGLTLLVTLTLFIGFALSDPVSLAIIAGIAVLTYVIYRLFVRKNRVI